MQLVSEKYWKTRTTHKTHTYSLKAATIRPRSALKCEWVSTHYFTFCSKWEHFLYQQFLLRKSVLVREDAACELVDARQN